MQAGPVSLLPSDAEIQARVNALYAPMQNDILNAMRLASYQSQARLQAIGGLGGAWGGLLQQIAPHASEGYFGAQVAAPQFAGAAGGQIAGRLASDMAGSRAFTQSVAPAAQGAPPVDAGAVGGVLTGLQGTIPAALYGAEGAAQQKIAEGDQAAAKATTSYDITEETLKAAQVDQQYVQQLIDLAEKRPEMYFQVVDQIREMARQADADKLEREKFEYDKNQADREYRSGRLDANRQYGLAKADDRRQSQALALQAKELGYNVADDKADNAAASARLQYQYKSLELQTQKAVVAAQQAEAKGRQIDAAASKVRGFVVDRQGRYVMEGGKRIKVAPSATSTSAKTRATAKRTSAISKARTSAFSFGQQLLKDHAVKTPDLAPPTAKAYIRRQGPGGRIFETTDDPAKALKSITFAEAMQQAWGAVDGDTLVQVYGLTAAQVRKQIRQALIRAGWTPDGKRP